MKGLKLAVVILALGTIAISPKAHAKSLSNTRQIFISQVTAPLPTLQDEKTNDAKAYLERGFERFDKKDYQGAIEYFNQVLKIEPNNAYAYVGRGVASFFLEEYQAAKADLDKALEITPDLAHAYYFRGFTNYLLKDKQGAIADLQKAAELYKKEGKPDLAQNANNAIQKIEAS